VSRVVEERVEKTAPQRVEEEKMNRQGAGERDPRAGQRGLANLSIARNESAGPRRCAWSSGGGPLRSCGEDVLDTIEQTPALAVAVSLPLLQFG